MKNYLTVKEVSKGNITVMKSQFYSFLFHVENVEEVNNYVKELKKEYEKARHVTYAYIIDNIKKAYDDKEPQGTAGRPLLEILEKNNMNYALICVVRIFGGTLLGSGRLLRTYKEAGLLAFKNAKLFQSVESNLFSVEIKINGFNTFKNFLSKNNCEIDSILYEENVKIKFYCLNDVTKTINDLFYDMILNVEKENVIRLEEVKNG